MRLTYIVLLLAVGCRSIDAQAVPVVHSQRPVWTAANQWRLGGKPILDIGTADGDPNYEFGLISGVLKTNDGRWAIADMQANQIRFFDAGGKFLKTAGRRGEGPGEWTQLARLVRYRGDTILGSGFTASHELFTSDGAHVRRLMLQGGADLTILGFRSDGSSIAYSGRINQTSRKTGEWIDSTEHFVYSADGARIGTLGRLPFVLQTNIGGRAVRLMFGAASAIAVGDDYVYHNFTDDYEIDVYDRTGKLARKIRRAWTPIAVTKQDISNYRESYINSPGDDGSPNTAIMRQERERSLERVRFARTFAAHSTMVVDRIGNLWVRETARPTSETMIRRFYAMDSQPRTWSVFDPRGRWLGQFVTPPGFFVFDIGADYIAGAIRDEFDVPHVRVYAIQKPGCRTPEC
jgi:hypothetical protein